MNIINADDVTYCVAPKPIEPFLVRVTTPVDMEIKEQPFLVVIAPDGMMADYVLGWGLMFLHERHGIEGLFRVDSFGEWRYQWGGIESSEPLQGSIPVVPMSTPTVVC